MVSAGNGNGSGVLIGRRTVLTVAHVAEMSDSLTVQGIPVHKVSEDRILDIAVLQADSDLKGQIAEIGPNVGVLDSVRTVGYPANFIFKMEDFVAQLTTDGLVQEDNSIKLIATGGIAPGNSGGGLFARDWFSGKFKLVGLADQMINVPLGYFSVDPLNYLGIYVSIPVIRQFLKYGEIVHYNPNS